MESPLDFYNLWISAKFKKNKHRRFYVFESSKQKINEIIQREKKIRKKRKKRIEEHRNEKNYKISKIVRGRRKRMSDKGHGRERDVR